MAYGGDLEVFRFGVDTAAENIVLLDIGLDFSATAIDHGVKMVPIPMKLYAFGVYLTEALTATMAGSLFLEREEKITGSPVTVVEFDLDTVNAKSGDNELGLITAAAGSESTVAGDVIYADSTRFPQTIFAPQYLTCRHVATALAGEGVPFIAYSWMGIDYTPTSVWVSA